MTHGKAVVSLAADKNYQDLEDESDEYGLADLLQEFSRLHPDVVATIAVDLDSLGPVSGQLVSARIDEDDSTARLVAAAKERNRLVVQMGRTERKLRTALALQAETREAQRQAESDLRDMAVSTFIVVQEATLEGPGAGLDGNSLEEIASDSQRRLSESWSQAQDERIEAEAVVAQLENLLDELGVELDVQVRAWNEASADLEDAELRIENLQPEFEYELMTTLIRGTDIPVVVFDAYYRAELQTAQDRPSCRVTWNQLAGIGKVESSHGSFGGNTVGVTGRTDGEILGPVLNGDPFAAIADTDGGRLDGDTIWDRAVGPMQFIPGSWSIFGADGDGDGTRDPHNIYDAALAAANHLCGTTGGLDKPENFQVALLGYNQSVPYGELVMSFADNYLRAVGSIVIADQPVIDELAVTDFANEPNGRITRY